MTQLVPSNCKLSKLVPSPPCFAPKPVSPVLEGEGGWGWSGGGGREERGGGGKGRVKQATRKRVGELVAVSVCGGSQQTERYRNQDFLR